METLLQTLLDTMKKLEATHTACMSQAQKLGFQGLKRLHRLNSAKIDMVYKELICDIYDIYDIKMQGAEIQMKNESADYKEFLTKVTDFTFSVITDLGNLNKQIFENKGYEMSIVNGIIKDLTDIYIVLKRFAKLSATDLCYFDKLMHDKIECCEDDIKSAFKSNFSFF